MEGPDRRTKKGSRLPHSYTHTHTHARDKDEDEDYCTLFNRLTIASSFSDNPSCVAAGLVAAAAVVVAVFVRDSAAAAARS